VILGISPFLLCTFLHFSLFAVKTTRIQFSVIVPSLNQARFVRACLDSLLAARSAGVLMEIHVQDGGSREETLRELEAYRQDLASLVVEADGGQADAINRAFGRCQGEWVCWLNTDDCWIPENFVAFSQWLNEEVSPECQLVLGQGKRVDEEGRMRSLHYPEDFEFDRRVLLFGENIVFQPGCFMRREGLVGEGGTLVDARLHYAFDTDLWLRLTQEKTPVFYPHSLACSREYPETKTASGSWKRAEEIRQVAQKHSHLPITPGSLHVLWGTLLEAVQDPEVRRWVPDEMLGYVAKLRECSGQALARCSGSPDGMSRKAFPAAGPWPWEGDRETQARAIKERMEAWEAVAGKDKDIRELTALLRASEEDRKDRLKALDKTREMIQAQEKRADSLHVQIKSLIETCRQRDVELSSRDQQIKELQDWLLRSEEDRSARQKTADLLAAHLQATEKHIEELSEWVRKYEKMASEREEVIRLTHGHMISWKEQAERVQREKACLEGDVGTLRSRLEEDNQRHRIAGDQWEDWRRSMDSRIQALMENHERGQRVLMYWKNLVKEADKDLERISLGLAKELSLTFWRRTFSSTGNLRALLSELQSLLKVLKDREPEADISPEIPEIPGAEWDRLNLRLLAMEQDAARRSQWLNRLLAEGSAPESTGSSTHG